jgi:hypothetical protein
MASNYQERFKPRSITIIHINGFPEQDHWGSRGYSGPPLDFSRAEMTTGFAQRGAMRGSEGVSRAEIGIPDLVSLAESLLSERSRV